MDEFVANNMDIGDVDFDDMSVCHWEYFGQQQNLQYIGTVIIMLSLVEICV